MPDILEMLANNPEAYKPQEVAAPPPRSTPELNEAALAEGPPGPSWQDARAARTNQHLMNPDAQASLAAHHAAVADAAALNHQTEQEFTLLHAAHTLHDTGAYYQEAHGIHPSDPDYEDKFTALAAKYPFAKPDAALMQPLHQARTTYQTATGMQAQREMEKEIDAHVAKGNLTADDLADPNANVHSLRLLAAQRQAAMPKALNAEEKGVLKDYNTPKKLNALLGASDDDPYTKLQKTLYYSARNKISPPAPAAAGGAPAPTATSLILK